MTRASTARASTARASAARAPAEVLDRLRAELKGGGIALAPSGIVSFDAVRVVGPGNSLLVSVYDRGDGIDFLAVPEPDTDPDGPYESIGTEEQITQVAGIIRRRVGAV